MSDLDDLRLQVRRLTDRAEIGDLVDRFSRDLDDYTAAGKPFDVDWVRRYFTEDASVSYPVGTATGAAAVSALIDGTGMAPFARTHHVTTNYVLDLDGDPTACRSASTSSPPTSTATAATPSRSATTTTARWSAPPTGGASPARA